VESLGGRSIVKGRREERIFAERKEEADSSISGQAGTMQPGSHTNAGTPQQLQSLEIKGYYAADQGKKAEYWREV